MKLIFNNDGHFDIRGSMIFGLNAKQNKSAIGYFGTGLKYAIAVILREGGSITIQSGLYSYEFTKKDIDFRDKEFSIICMNGQELGFTTELGKNWKPWMAFRELYCNAIDENGSCYLSEHSPEVKENIVNIVVDCDSMESAYHTKDNFILKRNLIHSDAYCEIHDRESTGVFYKGILVWESPRKMKMTYNITSDLELTEDRTAKSQWSILNYCQNVISTITEEAILRKVTTAGEYYYDDDFDLNWDSWQDKEQFVAIARKLVLEFTPNLNKSLINFASKFRVKDLEKLPAITLSSSETRTINKATSFLKKAGIDNIYPIIFVERLEQGVMGQAFDNRIYISKRAIESGSKYLASTIYEEYIHLHTGFKDESRNLQTYLFDKVISLFEEITGETL